MTIIITEEAQQRLEKELEFLIEIAHFFFHVFII